jgi:hypothetical protein
MFEFRIKQMMLQARYELQQRAAVRCRHLGNVAMMKGDDKTAALYDRSAEFAELRAAALFAELLDLAENYLEQRQ